MGRVQQGFGSSSEHARIAMGRSVEVKAALENVFLEVYGPRDDYEAVKAKAKV